MPELHRDDFGVIILHPAEGILELEWLEGSANMTDDDFMRSMERYASFAEVHRTPNMLVDVRNFRHVPGKGASQWRDEHIIPRYNAAGVKRFAFLFPAGASGTVESGSQPGPEPPGSFPTGYFENREHISDWFSD